MSKKSMTFADKIKQRMGEACKDTSLIGGTWRNISYNHIFKDKKDNFINKEYPRYCNVKGNLFYQEIKYHDGAAHMNSSQVMCINFFKTFFENGFDGELLLELLRKSGLNFSNEAVIESAIFEYIKDPSEMTNFDFYIVLNNGTTISFEIKYTESEFGSVSKDKKNPEKYSDKWRDIYSELVEKSAYLSGCNEKRFYENYQINRNIVFASEGDIVLFLTPRANDSKRLVEGRKYIDELKNPNIRNVYWEDIVDDLLGMLKEESMLKEYYTRFKEKYIDVLKEE